jgi:hypothetical protein
MPEGLQRVQQLGPPQTGMSPQMATRRLEQALGNQKITVTGVPATSHFARVIVAADFRMKRLAMDIERAPISGMPSFLRIVANRRVLPNNMMPRWWLAANYEPIRRDQAGLAWELRGQGVKCMNEDQFLAQGQIQRAGKSDPNAQEWADTFTEKFDELSREDSTFGELRNVFDLSVVAALAAKENLFAKAGLEIPHLRNELPFEEFHVPRAVPSHGSFVRARREKVISASGGVQIFPWEIADRTEIVQDLAAARPERNDAAAGAWYYQTAR